MVHSVYIFLNLDVNKKNQSSSDDDNDLYKSCLKKRKTSETHLDAQYTELDEYYRMPPLETKACPIAWWGKHREQFPILTRVAINYLGVPATSVPSVRVFSGAAHTCTSIRNRLGTDSISALQLLKAWMNDE